MVLQHGLTIVQMGQNGWRGRPTDNGLRFTGNGSRLVAATRFRSASLLSLNLNLSLSLNLGQSAICILRSEMPLDGQACQMEGERDGGIGFGRTTAHGLRWWQEEGPPGGEGFRRRPGQR